MNYIGTIVYWWKTIIYVSGFKDTFRCRPQYSAVSVKLSELDKSPINRRTVMYSTVVLQDKSDHGKYHVWNCIHPWIFLDTFFVLEKDILKTASQMRLINIAYYRPIWYYLFWYVSSYVFMIFISRFILIELLFLAWIGCIKQRIYINHIHFVWLFFVIQYDWLYIVKSI